MEQIVVKTEVQSNGEILLYYVDENGESQEGVLTTIENIDNDTIQIQDNAYMLESYEDLVDDTPLQAQIEELTDPWSEEDTKRLLIFFNDNKTSFVSGTTQKKHLWAVACKTMLIGKDQLSCEEKLSELKTKYCEVCGYIKKGIYVKWPFLDLCHQAFHDDDNVMEVLKDSTIQIEIEPEPEVKPKMAVLKQEVVTELDGILSIKQMNTRATDEKVEQMLNLYLKYKESFQKEYWRRDIWDRIAKEMGEKDSEYLQKRFLNHKQHYISILLKAKELGSSSVTWPYKEIFDKIYCDDVEFHKKNFNTIPDTLVDHVIPEHEWNNTQKIILAKYYFDCYEEFEDRTIPNKFLWSEVGKLIDKQPDTCETRYKMLRREHLEKYYDGDYRSPNRIPIAIIFDSIIVKDVKTIFNNSYLEDNDWETGQLDELVQFFHHKTELFKDHDCHFVCFAAIAQKLNKSVNSCKQQWDELVTLYKTILEDKKEDPDLQIDWRYIDLFDRIFDYGMDLELLKGYDASQPIVTNTVGKVSVKQVKIEQEKKNTREKRSAKSKDDPDYTENSSEPRTDPRSAKILEHYLKNKDKFQHVRNKLTLWESLSKQIGVNTTQCAHRFRTLKQTYIEYLQKEIDKPRIPITWPYFALCKKVFGYRWIKTKIKQGDLTTDNEDWLPSEIKLLITFFSNNYLDITNNIEDVSKWSQLATQLNKSLWNCKEKFLELRKCYRKLRTMKTRNPDVKISWCYFDMFDEIYNKNDREQPMEVEKMEEEHLEEVEGGDDDYQCIIVLPDEQGQDLLDVEIIDNSELIQQLSNMPEQLTVLPQELSEMSQELSNMPQELTDMSQELSNIPQELSDMSQELSNIPQELSNATQEISIMPQELLDMPQQLSNMPQLDVYISYSPLKTNWTKHNKKLMLILYINHIRSNRNKEIVPKVMWAEIAAKLPNKTSVNCRKMFAKMKNAYKHADELVKKKSPYSYLLEKVLKLKPRFVKDQSKTEEKIYKDFPLASDKVNMALEYYLEHIEEFLNPRFEKKYLWTQLANHISEPVTKVYNKINYLKQAYNIETEEIDGEKTEFSAHLKELIAKEVALKTILDINPSPDFNDQENTWSDDDTEQLMHWYLTNLDKFKNPKFNRSYLWIEVAILLSKSPLGCSKKMSEIRSQYRNMVKQNADGFSDWRFFDLCQKIYGTGRKNSDVDMV